MRKMSTVLIGCAIVLMTIATRANEAPRLRITGALWTPYVDQSLPNFGLAAELVGTGLRRAGYELDPKVETWPRAYKGVAIGVYDVVVGVWESEARAQDLVFSAPYLINDVILLARVDAGIVYDSLADLIGYRIGVVNGYAYGGGFDTHPRLIRIANNHLTQNLLLLRQRKIDLVIGDRLSIFYEISRFMPSSRHNFRALPNAHIRRGLSMGVSRKYADSTKLIAAFDAAILAMNEDGTFDAIVAKHTKDLGLAEPGPSR